MCERWTWWHSVTQIPQYKIQKSSFPPLIVSVLLQFPTLLNGSFHVPLPSVDAPSPLLLSPSSHKSWCLSELLKQTSGQKLWPDQHLSGSIRKSLNSNDEPCGAPLSPVRLWSETWGEAFISEKSISIRHFFDCLWCLIFFFYIFFSWIKTSEFLEVRLDCASHLFI